MTAIDGLAIVGPDLFDGGQSADDVLQRAVQLEVVLTIIAAARPPDYHLGPANDMIAGLCRKHPDRFRGLARVDPNRPDAVDELSRAYAEVGLVGLFLHPAQEHFSVTSAVALRLLEANAMLGRPVVIAAGYPWASEGPQVAEVARRYPETEFVLTTGGQINVSGLGQFEALRALRDHRNIRVHTTGVYRQDFLERVMRDVGPDRLIFAGGTPRFDARFELMRVLNLSASSAELDAVLAGSARAVFQR